MNKEYINPLDIFKPPFTVGKEGTTIWFNDGQHICFDILDYPQIAQQIVECLNDDFNKRHFDDIGISSNGEYICNGHTPILKVRRGYVTGIMGKTGREEDKIVHEFVEWAADQLGYYGETQLSMMKDANKCLREELDMYKAIIHHFQENTQAVTDSVLECLEEGIYQNNGYVKGTFGKSHNGHPVIRFNPEGEGDLTAEWYEDWKYGVLQYNDWEDSYHGYLLLPRLYTIKEENGIKTGEFLCLSYSD